VGRKWDDERERLILDNRELAHRYAAHYSGWLERDDLMAGAELALVKAARSFRRDGGDFSGWLHTCVRREIVDEYRRRHGDARCPSWPIIVSEADIEVLDEPDVDDVLDFTRRLRRVPKRTAAVMLARYEGYSLHEIASRLGVSDSRITQLVREGYARFRGS
jgi:RNA polymerase sigma factor (sigma-70 family)